MMRFSARKLFSCLALLVLGIILAVAPSAMAGAQYSATILADTPIAYWRLGENSTATIAADSSGNTPGPSNGFYTRGVTSGATGAIAGDTDTAASFDGSSAFVLIPNSTNGLFDLTSSFTLEAWVINKGQSGAGEAGRVFSNREPGFGFGIKHVGTPDSVRFTTFGVKDYDSDMTVVPQDGNWHHLVVVFDASYAANFYLDGVPTESIPGPGPAHSSASDLNIGRNPHGDEEFFTGSIDEAAIYNYELTAAQIAAHYQAAK